MTSVRGVPIVVAALVLIGCGGAADGQGMPVNAALEGHPMPSAAVARLDGTAIDTAELVGAPLVLNVWGSTCGPCKKELPDFAAAHAQYGDRIRFVGLSYLPPSQREESFARDRGINYELLYDATGSFITEAGIVAFPVTLFIDADGTVLEQTGLLDAERLGTLIEEVLL